MFPLRHWEGTLEDAGDVLVSGPIPSLVKSGSGLSGVASIATAPGIAVIDLSDGTLGRFLGFPERPARYHMFIQVERVP